MNDALDRLKLALPDRGVSPFFLRECDLLNRLDHPQIVCVHEVAEAANVCYMVTEHLHGATLQERLTCEGQIPIVDAVEIASDLAEGLSHAHARGVVLRAVEPRCVTLVPGRPVITDVVCVLYQTAHHLEGCAPVCPACSRCLRLDTEILITTLLIKYS